ncbi:MAG: hypothetical protein E4H27_03040 [Anaerolineales bacterium]|nr:MAG: hypothetical protein E4H27_03040 [Anaerolineales bacterium]
MKRSSWSRVMLVLFIAIVAVLWIMSQNVGPQKAESLSETRIYAYREWQSVGILVEAGDRVDVRAEGRWSYTPGEYHGPEGHRYYQAPNTYPINAAAGGVLIGRIGENGAVFLIGKGRTFIADKPGLLFFRINDDILSDNEGYAALEILVTMAEINE